MVVLFMVQEDAINLQLNKMGMGDLKGEIQTPVLKMVATILVRQTKSYLFSHTSPIIIYQSSIYRLRNRHSIRNTLKKSHQPLIKVSYNFKLIQQNSL